MPPLDSLLVATPTRVTASGGFDLDEMPGSVDVLSECTDGDQTACVPMDKEQPVIAATSHTHAIACKHVPASVLTNLCV